MRYEVWENLAPKYNGLWVQKYSLGPTRREVKKIVLPLLAENPELQILEVGCGTGQLIKEISEQYPGVHYLGIDVAQNMVEIAAKDNTGKNVSFQHCPVEDFMSEEKYDVILCTHAFPYFPEKAEVLKKMAGLCKEKGRVIIANSSTNSLKDLLINFGLKATTSKAKYLSIEEMKKLFEGAGLDLKDVRIIRERFYMPTIALFDTERNRE